MSVLSQLKNVQLTRPIWSGPESSDKNGGVTQSLLGKFLSCPSRFKALVIDNLRTRRRFSKSSEYGTMFHLCDEWFNKFSKMDGGELWELKLRDYVAKLVIQYPFDQEEILKWYRVCQIQFPIYLDYWRSHHEDKDRTSIEQEGIFHVPYKLPSGRVVYLRGRRDAVELDEQGIWLCESKTKGDVDPEKIQRRLKYDLQTMLYLIALDRHCHVNGNKLGNTIIKVKSDNHDCHCSPIKGVRYNVIRRPLSGGKGTIKQTKNETVDQYYDRLAQYIKDEPHTYFFRWQSEVSADDIQQFEKNTLIPCLERLCAWYEMFNPNCKEVGIISPSDLHYTMPFGVTSQVSDEWGTEYDEYILTGSTVGLETCTELFPELQE